MVTVPMAGIGVWLALGWPLLISKPLTWAGVPGSWLTWLPSPRPLSTQVFIGIILLAGYVVNAAIILVDHFTHLDPKKTVEARLCEAGADRLRPILMTVCSTVLGFLPMAMSFGQASDLWAPLAVTVIGGLMGSTILTLFVLPCLIVAAEDAKGWIKNGMPFKMPQRFHFLFFKPKGPMAVK
jgi:HAE1 family hydrophobic/amphiphilic exporter-1